MISGMPNEMPPLMTPESQQPMPTVGMDPRQKVAMALQYQKGLFKKTPMGDFGNSLASLYNQYRDIPLPPTGVY